MRYIVMFLLLGVLSCKSQKNIAAERTNGELVLLTQDGYSAIESFETMIVHDQKTLNGFYGKINKTRKPGIPVPAVDFSREMVIVVCMGEQLGEDLPDLIKKREDEQEIILEINPFDKQVQEHSTLISSPFCVYKMPKTEKDVVFINN